MIRSTLSEAGRRAHLRGIAARLGAALLLLCMAGCAPGEGGQGPFASLPAAPEPGGPNPARLGPDRIVMDDGAVLPLRRWLPNGEVRAVILGLHGFNDYSHALDMPAQVWAARGIATFAYDQRGFGEAPGHGFWAGSARLAADAATAVRLLRAAYPGRPVYLLGESMGGAVAAVAATGVAGTEPPAADGVILAAPAVWGRPVMDFLPKLSLFAGVRLFPSMTLTGSGLGIRASDNIPMLQALGRDPLVIKATRVDTVYGLVNLMDAALEAAPRLSGRPLLLMYGAHDELIPAAAMRAFAAGLPPDPEHRRRLAYYRDGFHMMLRDLEFPLVAGDVAAWIFDGAAPLPSGADRTQEARPWPPQSPNAG